MTSAVEGARQRLETAQLDAPNGVIVVKSGYKQEIKQQLNLWEITALMYGETLAWIGMTTILSIPYSNGGFTASIYGLVFAFSVATCIVGCLNELISMYPTAGAQYHFVAILAPKNYARPMSFVCGWMCLIFWLLAATSQFLAFTQQIFSIAGYFQPDVLDYTRWIQIAVTWGLISVCFVCAAFYVRLVARLAQVLVIFTSVMLLATVVALLVLTPNKNSAKTVFASVTVESGWENQGFSWIIGAASTFFNFSTLDSTAHLVEDTKNPRKDVPRANLIGISLNFLFALTVVIVLGFCTIDVDGALAAAPNYPYIAIVMEATQSEAAAIVLASANYASLVVICMNVLLVTSRIMFSLARDNAMPFSHIMSKVHPRLQTPVNATLLCAIISAVLSLIYVGNTTAFFAIANGASIFSLLCYILPILLVIVRGRDKINLRQWDMGRYGIICYYVSTAFGLFMVVILCFPFYMPATPITMNYSSVVFAGGLLVTAILWFVYGRSHFHGPLIELHGMTANELSLSAGHGIVLNETEVPSDKLPEEAMNPALDA